jgi:hypothetical protein
MKKRNHSTADILITLLVVAAFLGSLVLSEFPEELGLSGQAQLEGKRIIGQNCGLGHSATAEEKDMTCVTGICAERSDTCIEAGEVWANCLRDNECGEGLHCQGDSCVLDIGKECSSTSTDDQCTSRLGLPKCGYSTILSKHVCMNKKTIGDLGAACDYVDGANFITCQNQLECKVKGDKSVCDYR